MVKRKTVKTNAETDKSSVEAKEEILNYTIKVSCKNEKQKEFVNSLKDNHKEICFGVGSAGTGKTFLSLMMALKLLKTNSDKFKKIYIFVNPCESTRSLSIGFLKGTYEEKIEPYIQNSINNIQKILELSNNKEVNEIVGTLISKGIVSFEIINYVKGKTFENCICLVEEAEDLSKEDVLLLLTRKGGKNCKYIITGDDKQISRDDIRKHKSIAGLTYAANVLKDLEEVSVTEFTVEDIVRDELITKIIKKFEEN